MCFRLTGGDCWPEDDLTCHESWNITSTGALEWDCISQVCMGWNPDGTLFVGWECRWQNNGNIVTVTANGICIVGSGSQVCS